MVDNGHKDQGDEKENKPNKKDQHVRAGLKQTIIHRFFADGLFEVHGNQAGEMDVQRVGFKGNAFYHQRGFFVAVVLEKFHDGVDLGIDAFHFSVRFFNQALLKDGFFRKRGAYQEKTEPFARKRRQTTDVVGGKRLIVLPLLRDNLLC